MTVVRSRFVRPNVLFILTDQQRADSLGRANHWAQTPNLDALAAAGTTFSTCITTAPVCIPARFSLATGLYPHNLGVQRNGIHTLSTSRPTWMSRFREAGYRTSGFGKTHLHPHLKGDLRDRVDLLHAYGFDDVDEIAGPRALARARSGLTDEWASAGVLEAYTADLRSRLDDEPWVVRPSPVGLSLYYDTYVGEHAQRYLERYDRNEPWLCCVGFPGPHEPWDTPPPWSTLHDPSDAPPPAPAPASAGTRPTGYLDERIADRPPLSLAQIAAMRADYAGGVSLIDDLVGRIVTTIKERGEWDRTIVVFTSDHGELNGDAGLIYKNVFLDGSCRVPLIIRDPATGASRDEPSPVEMFDVAPTMLELAGIDHDFGFTRSLAGLVRGDGPAPRTSALSEYDGEVLLVTDEWKAAVNRDGDVYLLFDRSAGEAENLAGVEAFGTVENELRKVMLERLVQSSSRTPAPGPGPAVEAAVGPPRSTGPSMLRRLRRGGRSAAS
jgi:arylsulfatase A-like enzyme